MSRLEPDSGDGRGGEGRRDAVRRRRPAGPFGYADFRLLWLTGLSWTATRELRLLVVSFWLLEETGSAAQLGILGAVQLAVQVPALLYGGTLADRVDRRRLLALSQLPVLVGVGLMGLLDLAGELQPWHIYAGTAVIGASTVLGQPARGALIASSCRSGSSSRRSPC